MEIQYLSLANSSAPIPEWQDIEFIARDLRQALDSITGSDRESMLIRTQIARAIAYMREEKILEKQYSVAKQVLTQFNAFSLQDGGIMK